MDYRGGGGAMPPRLKENHNSIYFLNFLTFRSKIIIHAPPPQKFTNWPSEPNQKRINKISPSLWLMATPHKQTKSPILEFVSFF